MLLAGLIALIVAAVVFMILWKVIGWSWWLSLIIGVVLGLILGAMLLFWVFPKFSGFFTAAPNAPPVVQPTPIVIDATSTPITIVPPTPAVLTGPVANRLKYDETGCDPQNLVACRIIGQTEFPAIFVRRIQSGVLSLTQGIVAIQQLAAAAGVPTNDAWTTMTADPVYATFVWCPAGNCSYPPDTAFPLMGIPGLADVQFSLAIVSAHSPSTPPASINTVTCPNSDCWSAPLQ